MSFGAQNLQYGYDDTGLVNEILGNYFGRNYQWTRNTDALKRPTQDILPNGIKSTYQYNANSELLDLKNLLSNQNILSEFNYGYSNSGTRVSLDEGVARMATANRRNP